VSGRACVAAPPAFAAGPRRAAQAGVALPVVLWLIILLVATIGAFALASRMELLQGRVLADGAQGGEVARAGIEYAMARVDDPRPQRRWIADGRPYRWSFAGAELELRIVDEAAKVDLNHADRALLEALLEQVGAGPEQARRLAGEIVDWRDPDALPQPGGGAEDGAYAAAGLPHGARDAPFQSVAELQRLPGMTPALFADLAPHVTVFSGLSRPDPRLASGPVRAALGPEALPVASGGMQVPGSGTYSIQSTAKQADGRATVLHAVLRNGADGVPGAAFAVMRWNSGASGR
jgi:general secretion pathway protein K